MARRQRTALRERRRSHLGGTRPHQPTHAPARNHRRSSHLGPTACSLIINGADLEALCQDHDYPYTEVQHEAGKDYTDVSDPAVVLQIVPQWHTIRDETQVIKYCIESEEPLVWK